MVGNFKSVSSALVRFYNDEEAATAVEYGLLASLIAAAIIGAIKTVGGSLNTTFNRVSSGLGN